ncbi:hypothetical protein GCM10010270_71030 [Streptomyces violaceus]|nr:hypothetical protein GCM10010270_71030 [Streptomyces janthinus]
MPCTLRELRMGRECSFGRVAVGAERRASQTSAERHPDDRGDGRNGEQGTDPASQDSAHRNRAAGVASLALTLLLTTAPE